MTSDPSDAQTRVITGSMPPPSVDGLGEALVGSSIGRYVVLGELGRGGMGRVSRAYDPTLQREVALKEVRRAALDDELEARLVAEARAMARLSHPNVVAVHDVEGGDEARLVIVMEYVAGGTLSEWMRKEDHSWREIVARFVSAGRGLAAAHAAGLLHRDFKPANVLVGEDEGRTIVKVTDFGLAKGVAHPATAETEVSSGDDSLTRDGTVMGTPRYMAPEQHLGGELTPAADQYAFCVSLWEALCGEHPFAGATGLAEVAKLKAAGPPSWSAASVPRTVVDAVRRGLSPDPNDRWPDMARLLEVLDDDPSRRRSRRLAAVAGVLAVGGIAAGWRSWASSQRRPCTGAAAHLEGAWDEPRREQVRAAIVGTELAYAGDVWERTERVLDEHAEAWTTMHTETCEATTVRGEQSAEVMDLRMACLRRARLALQATTTVLADADETMVPRAHTIVAGLADLDRCADVDALMADEAPPAAEELEAVRTAEELLAQAKARRTAGRYAEARSKVDEAKEALAGVEYPPIRIELLLMDGYVLDHLGDHEASEEVLGDALDLALAQGRLREVQRAASKLLHVVGYKLRRSEEAMHRYRALATKLRPHDLVARTAALNHLALVLNVQGKNVESEQAYREALAIQEELLPPGDPDLARLHSNLGVVLWSQGKYPESEAENRLALELSEGELGPSHPGVIASRANLAIVLGAQGRYAEAEAEQRQVLEASERVYGPVHPEVGNALSNLAAALNYQGENEEAEALHRRALDVRIETLGPEHPAVGESLNNLAIVLHDVGKSEEAVRTHERAMAIRANASGPDSADVANSLNNLAVVLAAIGRTEEAEAKYRQALAILEKTLGDEHPHVAQTRHNIAGIAIEDGRPEVALELAEKAWTRRQRDDMPPEERAETAFVLARALWETGEDGERRDRALTLARRAITDYETAGDAHTKYLDEVRAWLDGHRLRR